MTPCPTCERLNAENLVLRAEIERLRAALRPFADYADKHNSMARGLVITNGSPMAKRQLTMGDCYKARRALEGNVSSALSNACEQDEGA